MRKLMLLVLCLLCGSSFAGSTQAPTGCAQLPQKVVNAVLKDFPTSHVVTHNDLVSDDQEIWLKAYGNACPGWVSGTFRPGSHQYAITIVKASAGRLTQALVLVDVGQTGQQLLVLSPMQAVARVSVVRRLPGDISKPDAVIYEAIEAGYMVFSWTGNKFETEMPVE